MNKTELKKAVAKGAGSSIASVERYLEMWSCRNCKRVRPCQN